MSFSTGNIVVTPEQVLQVAGIISRGNDSIASQDLEEIFGGDVESQQVAQLDATKRILGFVQAKPRLEQEIFCHKFGALYFPKLAEAYHACNEPNSAAMVIMNMISASHYFVRFLYSPQGSDFLVLQAQRMATQRMIPYEDEHNTVAEVCQFLSTLLVLCDTELSSDIRGPLLEKLKAWRAQYRGRFAQETAERCIFMLEPNMSQNAIEMGAMRILMRQMLTKGVTSCKYKGCNGTSQAGGGELMRCSRCKARYCGVQHQRADWPTHKQLCFEPAF